MSTGDECELTLSGWGEEYELELGLAAPLRLELSLWQ